MVNTDRVNELIKHYEKFTHYDVAALDINIAEQLAIMRELLDLRRDGLAIVHMLRDDGYHNQELIDLEISLGIEMPDH